MKRARPYPAVMYRWPNPPIEVEPDVFMTQEEAARVLGVSLLGIGLMIGDDRLRAATLNEEPGVTRDSVYTELTRRKEDFGYRVRSFFRTLRNYLSW